MEIGGSHGQMYNKITYDAISSGTTVQHNWTKLRPMPVLRFARTFKTTGTIHSTIQLFLTFSKLMRF